MIRRPLKPHFSTSDKEELLKVMGRAMALAGIYGASIGYGSRQYQLADNLRDAVYALAEDLTGDPHYYAQPWRTSVQFPPGR